MTRHAPSKATEVTVSNPDHADRDGLEERIERLEKRLEETIASPEPPHVLVKRTLDDDGARDPLRRAVNRASEKRGAGR